MKGSEETRLNTSLQCEICNRNFKTKQNLNSHIASVHEKKKPYQCEICDKAFTEKSKMKLHAASVHEKKKPFK